MCSGINWNKGMHGPLKYCRIDEGDIRETMGEVMGRVLMIVAVLSVTPRAHLNLKSGDNFFTSPR